MVCTGWIQKKQRVIDQEGDTRKYLQQSSQFVWRSTKVFDDLDEEGQSEYDGNRNDLARNTHEIT